MSAVVARWTPENVQRAVAIVQQHWRLEDAVRAVSATLGFQVTRAALDFAFKRAGRKSAYQYLRKLSDGAPVEAFVHAPVPPVTDRDTLRMEAAPVFDLPDDSGTTVEVISAPPPPTAVELTAHRLKNRVSDLEARTKRLMEELAAKEDELANYKHVTREPRPIEAPPTTSQSKQRKGAAVLLCSDWHVEEPVYPETVNGLNEYSLEIADHCISRLAEGFAWMVHDSRFDVRTAVVALLGDLLSSYIHPELEEENLLSPQETMVWLLDRLERMLRTIAALCPSLERIVVPCKSGNHGRATDKTRVSTREANSNEQVIYQTLRRVMRDDQRFDFVITPGDWTEIDCMGYRLAFTHGDSFRYGGGVGGVSIPIRRGISRQFQGRQIHQFNMGHFHTRQDFGDIQINGSMIGYSPYSQFIHAAFEPRQQAFYMVDSERGKCLSAPIWLD